MTTNDLRTDKLSDRITVESQNQFTGRLDAIGSTTWSLYFCLGRLVWATGGEHQIRRWYRHLAQYAPQIPPNGVRLRETDVTRYWEYQVLTVLVKRQKLAGEQAVGAIKSEVAEVLFDILQYEAKQPLNFALDRENVVDASLTLINPTQAIQEAQQLWENWSSIGLSNLSPNLAPILKQPEELQKLASPRVYETLTRVIDGQRSLRDLAVQGKQDLVTLTRSLLPYIRKKIIGLVEISDLPKCVVTAIPSMASPPAPPTTKPQAIAPTTSPPVTPVTKPQAIATTTSPPVTPITKPPIATASIPSPQITKAEAAAPTTSPPVPPTTKPLATAPTTSPPAPPTTKPLGSSPATNNGALARPLIVYVEDSELDCQIMEDILQKASYGFLSVKDSMQALPLLLQHKPDAIFLDLVMPVANGYEICAQIRRISIFKNTPVIILTGNDGIVDRVRAKIVGATDFLPKPILAQKVLAALLKHLNNSSSLPQSQSVADSLSYQT